MYLMISCIVKLQCIFLQGSFDVPPVITLPYQPPDVCDGDGSGSSQLMYSTVAIIFLALMAGLF